MPSLPDMERSHLKRAVLRGGAAKMAAQGTNVLVRIGTLMLFARFLSPTEFGLVGMVMAVTGVLGPLKDFGLSAATVQRASISEAQMSALFWLNVLLGALLWLFCIALAPVLVWFYNEDRLFWITVVVTSGFFFAAVSVQHNALLQRQMRFVTLAVIEIFSLLFSAAIGLAMAALGFGYWALVGWSVTLPVAACLGTLIAGGWLPQLPSRDTSVRPLLRFGGLATLNLFVHQFTFNLDKVLVGRYWGAEILGFYGRANQLTGMATNNLLEPIGAVTFAALSRTQGDSIFLEGFFLKGYKLVVTVALPITVACVLFSEDIVFVLLGPNWAEVAPVLRLAGPLITIFALMHPTGWFLYALGRVGRALKVGLAILPVLTIGLVVGLPYGASGVAAGSTIAMALWVFPHLVWCTRDTTLSVWSMLRVVKIPAIAAMVAAAAAYGAHVAIDSLTPLPRLLVEVTVLSLMYVLVVLWTRDERAFYMGLLVSLRAGDRKVDAPRPGIA